MKLGLALSGGGTRGAAHIGAIKAFEENGIKFDFVGGTSAGSMAAALYSMGFTSDEMLRILKTFGKEMLGASAKSIISNMREKRDFHIRGFTTGKNIELIFKEVAKTKDIVNIKDIEMPLAITAVDLISGEKKVFTNAIINKEYYIKNIEIGKAVRASSSVPGVYSPLEFENYQLVDGGLLDNVPVTEVKKLGADRIVSINFEFDKEKKSRNFVDILTKSLDIMSSKIVEDEIYMSDCNIKINAEKLGMFDIDSIDEAYKRGYNAAKEKIEEIKKMMEE
ncbi:MAG: patatin-like phospholipase family protein [Clostridia bacterium]|nr:patatin-like phospholipase family protein [Clostridia bacterium]